MSSNGLLVPPEIVSLLQATFVEDICAVASAVIVIYDHLTTISDEVRYMWGRRWNSITILFYLNRWATVGWSLSSLANNFVQYKDVVSCSAVYNLQIAFTAALFVLWAVFSTIRVYAVSAGSKSLAVLVFGVSIMPAGITLYVDSFSEGFQMATLPGLGYTCIGNDKISEMSLNDWTVSSRACSIAADVAVLVITWFKTYRMIRDLRRTSIRSPIATTLLQDGTVYFMALLAMNVLHIVGSLTEVRTLLLISAGPFISLSLTRHSTGLSTSSHRTSLLSIDLAHPIHQSLAPPDSPPWTVIISRFLINLRRAAEASTNISSSLSSRVSTFPASTDTSFGFRRPSASMHLANFVDSMGELLEYTSQEDAHLAWERSGASAEWSATAASDTEGCPAGKAKNIEMQAQWTTSDGDERALLPDEVMTARA